MFKLIVTTMLTVLVGLTSLSAQALNDPTKPSYYQGGTAKKNSLQLSSVLWSDQRRVAIINGKALSEGDAIAGAKVVRIEKHQVRINQNGVLVNLKLRRPSIKREQ